MAQPVLQKVDFGPNELIPATLVRLKYTETALLQVCKAMPPQAITHVVASDLHDKMSKKLEHARNVQ